MTEQAPVALDAFALLGLPARFDVSIAELERAFHAQSKLHHADKFATAPAAERVAALNRSRALNDAYQTLKKPIARAEYMLSRAGFSIGSNERLDAGFLMEILEAREELSEARAAGDTSRMTELQAAMVGRHKAVVASLAPLFTATQSGDSDAWTSIKRQLIVLRYLDRSLEECSITLDEE